MWYIVSMLNAGNIKIVMIDASLVKGNRDVRCNACIGRWRTCHCMNRHDRISVWKILRYRGGESKHAVDRPVSIDRKLWSRGLADMIDVRWHRRDRLVFANIAAFQQGCRAAAFGLMGCFLRIAAAYSDKHVLQASNRTGSAAERADRASIACVIAVAGEVLQRGPCLRMSEHD